MTNVYCTRTDCINIGRKSSKYKLNNGKDLYTCSTQIIIITGKVEEDNYWKSNTSCSKYEMKKEKREKMYNDDLKLIKKEKEEGYDNEEWEQCYYDYERFFNNYSLEDFKNMWDNTNIEVN